MHMAGTDGLMVTRACVKHREVTYDYQHRILNPFEKGYEYTKNCRLVIVKDDKRQYAKIRGPVHADLTELRKSDLAKPKIAIIREPMNWYKTYWADGYRSKWKENNNEYTINGGDTDFRIWMSNMIEDSTENGIGYYTRYAQRFVGEPERTMAHILRFEHLPYDMHIAAELLLENWRIASDLKRKKFKDNSEGLMMSDEHAEMLMMLDSWIYQFYP